MPPDNASEPLRVVILNDTSQRYHHGCSRVMRLLVDGLVRHGMTVTARSPARHEWQNDAGFLDHMKDASLVVINGEGTLHHGRPAGADLLAVTAHPAAKNCAIAVVNALYQDNPDDWGKHLVQCDLLSARDAKSAAEMQRVCGEVPVRVVADLSLTDGAQVFDGPRNGILFGDSVKWNVRRAMALASMRIGADAFLPIKTLGSPFWRFPLARRLLYWAYNGVFGFRTPKFLMSKSEDAYLRDISKTAMHVTGRFHSVCWPAAGRQAPVADSQGKLLCGGCYRGRLA